MVATENYLNSNWLSMFMTKITITCELDVQHPYLSVKETKQKLKTEAEVAFNSMDGTIVEFNQKKIRARTGWKK